VVVVPLLMRDRSVLYLLSERVPYVIDGLYDNRGMPDCARRGRFADAYVLGDEGAPS